MITGRMRAQLVVFVLIAVVGIGYAGAEYAGLGRLFGVHGYTVRVELADSGGIFTNAEVSYRGVTVGRVGDLHLTPNGVQVDLDLDPSAPPIPASARAVVADRSAVGEQYVDLEPPDGLGPMLTDGSTIQQDRTSTPLPPETLLADLDSLSASVPADSLRTVVNELDTALSGTGPDLAKVLDSAGSLTRTATAHLPQTTELLSAGRTVLDTQKAEADQFTSFSGSLNLLAGQLRASDPAIRGLITAAPRAATQVDGVLRAAGTDLGVVVANLLTTARVMRTRTGALTEAFVEYPIAAAIGKSASPDGTGHLGFVLDFFDPMPCTAGYQGTTQHAGNDLSASPVNTQAYCALPPRSGVDVRGSNNAPFGGVPQAVAAPGTGATGSTPSTGHAATAPAGGIGGPGITPTTLAGLLGIG